MESKLCTPKQFTYIKRMAFEIDEQKLDFKTPALNVVNSMTNKAVQKLIHDMKEALGKKQPRKINQKLPWKNLSNIVIKKEWIVDWNYRDDKKGNSILVNIPFGDNKILEAKFPKGDHDIEYEDEYGNWQTKSIKALTYEIKDKKIYNSLIKLNEYLVCGVNLNWRQWFRIFDILELKIDDKKLEKFDEHFEIFNAVTNLFLEHVKTQEHEIIKDKLKKDKIKENIDQLNAEAGKNNINTEIDNIIVKPEVTIFNWLETSDDDPPD